jgi:hypothetical protein
MKTKTTICDGCLKWIQCAIFLLEFGGTGEHLTGGLEPSNGSAKKKTGLISSHLLVRLPNID